MQQFSPQTYQLAATYHLGTPLAEYSARVSGTNLFYSLLAALLVGNLTIQGLRSHQWLVLLPIVLILVLLWALLESTGVLRGMRIVICTEGLLRVHNDEADSIHWDEIRELWRNKRDVYTFMGTDGTRFNINQVFEHPEELGQTIEQEVTRRLLPQVEAMYRRGETVFFGRVRVRRAGLSTGRQTLPWNDLGEVLVHNGIIVTKQKMGHTWGSVSFAETPNLCVLEALIDSIVETL